MWHLIVSIPDLCALTYFALKMQILSHSLQREHIHGHHRQNIYSIALNSSPRIVHERIHRGGGGRGSGPL